MARHALKRRLQALEDLSAPPPVLPGVVMRVVDDSVPDPDGPPHEPPDYSDAAVIGLRCGCGDLARLPGESVPELLKRADGEFLPKCWPGTPVYFLIYAHEQAAEPLSAGDD